VRSLAQCGLRQPALALTWALLALATLTTAPEPAPETKSAFLSQPPATYIGSPCHLHSPAVRVGPVPHSAVALGVYIAFHVMIALHNLGEDKFSLIAPLVVSSPPVVRCVASTGPASISCMPLTTDPQALGSTPTLDPSLPNALLCSVPFFVSDILISCTILLRIRCPQTRLKVVLFFCLG
jgi:hypothetical protein